MIETTHLLMIGALLVVWSGGLYGFVEVAKLAARAKGVDATPWFVRSLPLLAPTLGAITGALGALRLVLEFAGVEVSASMPLEAVGAFLGVGAGCASAQAFKVWRQAIRAVDHRIEAGE